MGITADTRPATTVATPRRHITADMRPTTATAMDIGECTVRPTPTTVAPVIMAAGITIVGITTTGEVQRQGKQFSSG
jgi:hypothetical protein